MLLEVPLLLSEDGFFERSAPLLFLWAEQWGGACGPNFEIERDRPPAKSLRIGGRVGEDDHGCLKPFRTVDGHHPDLIAGPPRVALDIDRPAREPGEEAIERRRLRSLELQRPVHQLVDGIARRHSQPAVELAPAVYRTREHRLEK